MLTTIALPKVLLKSPYKDCLDDICRGIKTSFCLNWYGLDKKSHQWKVDKNLFNRYRLLAERQIIIFYTNQCITLLQEGQAKEAALFYKLLTDFRGDLSANDVDQKVNETLEAEARELSEDEIITQIKKLGFDVDGFFVRPARNRTGA